MKEIESADRYQRMNAVVDLYLEGKKEYVIARELGLKRLEVTKYLEEFKEVARSDSVLRERGREVVHEFDNQQSRVIMEMWDTIHEAEKISDLKLKGTLLKSLSDVQARRVEILQKSGLLSDAVIGDEMAALEEKQSILIGILREVTANCHNCREEVARRLSKVTGQSESIIVVPQG